MMLHRHFDREYSTEKITKLSDVTPKVVEPEVEETVVAPKRKGRPKKSAEG